MEFHQNKLNLRIYQQTILATATNHNTLCVLPTGLGKTYIAIALAGLKYKDGKVLMLAPTKPLLEQHKELFQNYFSGNIEIFSGSTPPKKRKEIWKSANIILSTPQTIKNDLINRYYSLKDVSLLVIDEAHRAIGDYAYVFLAQDYIKKRKKSRILALTASPGADKDKITEIKNNLMIEKIEARAREHPEVKQYIQPLIVDYQFCELPEDLLKIKKYIELALRDRLNILKREGYITSSDLSKISKTKLLKLQGALIAKSKYKDYNAMRALSLTASILKIHHALNLLESESIETLNAYLEEIWRKSASTKVKAIKDIVTDFNIRVAYKLTQDLKEKNIEHPKLNLLRKVLARQLNEKINSKILIFTEFRNNVSKIMDALDFVKADRFVGQASKTDKGMTQKEQSAIIQKLRDGKINCLVCTQVAEEGLDIPSVDLVIFYSPVPSAVRSIQRKGRTARHEIGKLVMLITKNTKDEAYFWISKHREKKMHATLQLMSNNKEEQKLDKFINESQKIPIRIIADNRENNKVIEELYKLNVVLQIKQLEVGDFILSDDLIIEKKEVADFVNSIIDGRLFKQAVNLKRNFKKPILLLEGNFEDLYAVRNIQPQSIRSALASIAIDYQIPILLAIDSKETAHLIHDIARREQQKDKKDITLRGSVKPWSLAEQQQFFIEGLPLMGPSTAKSLLKHFKTPQAIINASIEELKKVGNIGEQKAKSIKEILDTEYKE